MTTDNLIKMSEVEVTPTEKDSITITLINDIDEHNREVDTVTIPVNVVKFFPYIEQMYNSYNLVMVPSRKVDKGLLRWLIEVVSNDTYDDDDSFIFNSHLHYESLKSVAEFLLAEIIVDRLDVALCQQLERMSVADMVCFFGLVDSLSDSVKVENIRKLDTLIGTYLTIQQ